MVKLRFFLNSRTLEAQRREDEELMY